MKRTNRRSKAEFSPAVRAEIEQRSGGRCEAHTEKCTGKAVHIHHRRLRKSGDGSAENGLHVCRPCHTEIHHNVAISYEQGWLIRSN
jgi:hypothetical protein